MFLQAVTLIFLALLKNKAIYATNWPVEGYSELNVYLQGFTFQSSTVNSIFECYAKCEDIIYCASINMNLTSNACEMKYSTKTRHPEKNITQQNTIYMELRDALGTQHNPIPSCKWFKNLNNQTDSGVYWMKLNESSSAPFQVFCDMTTDGGGWTLVYSYDFTQYNAFVSLSNAVTPIPNWPLSLSTPSSWVPKSTTTPLSESSHSAMDFALWKKIGDEFLLKPNITNWVACVEGTGSLVNWVTGTVTCRIVKVLTPSCVSVVPTNIYIETTGPVLLKSRSWYIGLEGNTGNVNWPTHDPCGGNGLNHLKNVPYPGGVLYLR